MTDPNRDFWLVIYAGFVPVDIIRHGTRELIQQTMIEIEERMEADA